ncbi:MAG: DUF499 domain-containing protein, partial [candidate division Zixibacteria bacterium]|nr:DUF499 domain-containing protein [candidate division Zixibacteria bacterium]
MATWQEKLDTIGGLTDDGLYNQAVRDARAALEELLKKVYGDVVPKLAPVVQQKVSAEAAKIGKGKAADDFTLGEMVGLFSRTNFAELAGKVYGKKLEYLAAAPLNALNDLGNKVVHKKYDAGDDEAEYFAAQLGVLCRELGLLEERRRKKESTIAGGLKLRPWTEVVALHPDIESGELTESVFAIDLGAVEAGDEAAPPVYRDAREFFKSTYLTAELCKLLAEVLASLAGKKGYNRVIKLRTPFGGGKSHALVTLLHAARARRELDRLDEATGIADPGDVAVAVFDGEKFDARDGRTLPDGRTIRTMWGWVGHQLGEEAFAAVQGHDRDMVSPGGDVIKKMLAGKPKLILFDEVLKYISRAQAVEFKGTNLGQQTKDFFQNLTVEVAGGGKDVLVYSLPQSPREAYGDEALLQELDHFAARVDQAREPVTGDDILPVLQRRLLRSKPREDIVEQVAEVYSAAVGKMLEATAESAIDKKDAGRKAYELRRRICEAYPFHPAL